MSKPKNHNCVLSGVPVTHYGSKEAVKEFHRYTRRMSPENRAQLPEFVDGFNTNIGPIHIDSLERYEQLVDEARHAVAEILWFSESAHPSFVDWDEGSMRRKILQQTVKGIPLPLVIERYRSKMAVAFTPDEENEEG